MAGGTGPQALGALSQAVGRLPKWVIGAGVLGSAASFADDIIGSLKNAAAPFTKPGDWLQDLFENAKQNEMFSNTTTGVRNAFVGIGEFFKVVTDIFTGKIDLMGALRGEKSMSEIFSSEHGRQQDNAAIAGTNPDGTPAAPGGTDPNFVSSAALFAGYAAGAAAIGYMGLKVAGAKEAGSLHRLAENGKVVPPASEDINLKSVPGVKNRWGVLFAGGSLAIAGLTAGGIYIYNNVTANGQKTQMVGIDENNVLLTQEGAEALLAEHGMTLPEGEVSQVGYYAFNPETEDLVALEGFQGKIPAALLERYGITLPEPAAAPATPAAEASAPGAVTPAAPAQLEEVSAKGGPTGDADVDNHYIAGTPILNMTGNNQALCTFQVDVLPEGGFTLGSISEIYVKAATDACNDAATRDGVNVKQVYLADARTTPVLALENNI